MKEFDEWWVTQRIPSDIIPPHLEDGLVDAFRAGWLACGDFVAKSNYGVSAQNRKMAEKIREEVK